MTPILLEEHGQVAVIRLNSQVINAISPEVLNDLCVKIAMAKSNSRGLVLAGGDKFFSIGFDIPRLLEMNQSGMTDFFYDFNQAVMDLFTLPIPTACALKGHAIAGGTILLLACDYRFASDQKTLIGLNEIRLGVPTPYLADMMLRQITGDQVASDILYLGEFIESADAARHGIISEVFPKEEVENRAIEKISHISKFNLKAFAETKANRAELIRSRYESNYRSKNQAFLECWFSPETHKSLREAAEKSFGQKT